MKRFSILIHDHHFLHWDLLLEQDSDALTWRLASEPRLGETGPVESLPRHRLHYLDYEGPVTGGRGYVTCWDSGSYDMLQSSPGHWEILLHGKRLVSHCTLCQAHPGAWHVSWREATGSP